MAERTAIDTLQGNVAVPRTNGELVFEAPWQGRSFGLALALNEEGAFPWDRFRDELVTAIAEGTTDTHYYESWLHALEAVVIAEDIITPAELELRVEAYRSGQRDEVF